MRESTGRDSNGLPCIMGGTRLKWEGMGMRFVGEGVDRRVGSKEISRSAKAPAPSLPEGGPICANQSGK